MSTYSQPFYIALAHADSSDHVYTCGQKVNGTVVWRASSDTFARILVQFNGVVKTRVQRGSRDSRTTSGGKASLFEYSCILSPTVIRNNMEPRIWSFQFEFPYEAQPVLTNSSWSEHRDFHHLPGHPLPLSWLSGDRLQSISYYIEVIAHRTSSIFHSKVKDKRTLFFSPPRDVEHPDPQLHTQSRNLSRFSRKLDLALTKQPRRFKDTARRFFGTLIPSQPLSCFAIKSEVPTVGYVNGILPFIVGVEHDLAKPTSREVPVIYLNSIHARLTEYTNVRTPRSGDSSFTKSSKISIAQRQFMRLPMFERMNLAQDIRGLNMRIERPIAPSFKTYSVTRGYSIKITIKVSCAGKQYDLQLAKHDFLVLPDILVRRIAGTETNQFPALCEPPDTEQLPRYEETISQ